MNLGYYLFILIIHLNFLQRQAFYIDDDDLNELTTSTRNKTTANDLFTRKVTGYFLPPQTGEYKFYSSCDQACDVYLSGNDNPSGRNKIITQTKTTEADTYDRYPSQASHLIYLNKGKRYYMQAKTKFSKPIGKSHISVGVVLPDDQKLFPIVSPYVEGVTVEDIHTRQKNSLRETTGHTREIHQFQLSEKKRSPHDRIKSKNRLQKKLAQISSFVKDLEKAKKEEDTFDNKFNDAMKNLEENLIKYVGPKSENSEIMKPKTHKKTLKIPKKKFSNEYQNLQPKKPKSTTGSSRSFMLYQNIQNKKQFEKEKEFSKQKTVEDLLDALQKSLDTDSKKNKRFKYYHKKFEYLMDQINSLKGEVDKEEKGDKRKMTTDDSQHHKNHGYPSKYDEYAESGDGSGEEMFFDKKGRADETVEKYHNKAFSTFKSLDEPNIKHHSEPVDIDEHEQHKQHFHRKEHKENEKIIEQEEKETEDEHGQYSSSAGKGKPSKTTLKTDNNDESRNWNSETMATSQSSDDPQKSSMATKSYKDFDDVSGSQESMTENFKYPPKEANKIDDNIQEQQHNLTPMKQGFNVGIQSADESVYRLRDDGSIRIETDGKFKDSERSPVGTAQFEEKPSIKGIKEANGVVRSSNIETDLKGPLVVHASQGESRQMTKNDTVDKQDLKDLEDTLFKAFQERLNGESKPTSELSSKPIAIANAAPVKEMESNNEREQKPSQTSTMVKIDTGNLQSVLEQAFNGKSTNRDNTEIDSKFINSNNENLREKLQESIENAIIRNNKNVDDHRPAIVTDADKINYSYKADDNPANNIVGISTNTVNGLKAKQGQATYPAFTPGQIVEPMPKQSLFKSADNAIDQSGTARSNNNTVDADKRNVNIAMNPITRAFDFPKPQNTVSITESKNNIDNRLPVNGNYFQEVSQQHKSNEDFQYEANGKAHSQNDAVIMNYALDIDTNQNKINPVTDQQIYDKISELIKEINSIKMEIVAMKRNKVSVSNYKKSLVEKLKEKTKLLSTLQAKKNIIAAPVKSKL